MTRPKGSKNRPKVPELEYGKVVKLYADLGIPMPGAVANTPDKPAADAGNGPAVSKGNTGDDRTVFVVQEEQAQAVSGYECGNCGADLPGAVSRCPYCGSTLEWTV